MRVRSIQPISEGTSQLHDGTVSVHLDSSHDDLLDSTMRIVVPTGARGYPT
jgi:hypothetical protein